MERKGQFQYDFDKLKKLLWRDEKMNIKILNYFSIFFI